MAKLDAKVVRNAIVLTYPEDVKVYRKGLNCFGLVNDAYVCFNVQNDKYKPEVGLHFYVNWGVIPEVIHRANPRGLFFKDPSYVHGLWGLARGRLTDDPNEDDDQWFLPRTPEDLERVSNTIAFYAKTLWEIRLYKMTHAKWHIETLAASSSPEADKLIDILSS
ncbi:hypothetical protein N9C96_00325 [bacterium]|nr:hypothetical protein [bacterium]